MASADSPFMGRRESWDYAPAIREVASRFTGVEGIVLHFGDSITAAADYAAWARGGAVKAAEDEAVLKWSHCGEESERDGWYVTNHQVGELWSCTAAGGIRSDQFLAGGFASLPPFDEMVRRYRPQVAIVMLGTNDAWQGRPAEEFAADMDRIVRRLLDDGAIPILSTTPPLIPMGELGDRYNAELWKLAERRRLPVIDFHGEIVARRPDGSWNGTLLYRDDPHPTAEQGGVTAASPPTPENLRECGYLLRGWLSVQKLIEVKQRVLD